MDGPISYPITVATSEIGMLVSILAVMYLNFVMIVSTVSNPPVINSVSPINTSTVRVNWTRPTMPNGKVIHYTIVYLIGFNSEEIRVPYSEQEVSIDIRLLCM